MEIVLLIRDLARQRWLTIELVKRQLKLRHSSTWLGFIWTVLDPLIMTGVYTLVFSFFLRFDIPKYPVFLLCSLLPWAMWFAEAIGSGTNCLVDQSGFLSNSIFPSKVLPVVSVATGMMNYIFSLPILFIILFLFYIPPGLTLLALPLVMVVQFLFTLGIVFFLATYNVFFRDIRFLVQHGLLAFFFLTPVIYDYSIIPEQYQWLLKLNPMTHIFDAYRNIFFYNIWPAWENLSVTLIIALFLIYFGSLLFDSHKDSFAEYL